VTVVAARQLVSRPRAPHPQPLLTARVMPRRLGNRPADRGSLDPGIARSWTGLATPAPRLPPSG